MTSVEFMGGFFSSDNVTDEAWLNILFSRRAQNRIVALRMDVALK